MAVSKDYLAHAMECLARVVPVSFRRIFHGVGIYHQGVQFALIINDRVYFYTDSESRGLYERHAMSAFQPFGTQAFPFTFHQVPEDILNTPAELRYWMRTAVEVAQQASSFDEPIAEAEVEELEPVQRICTG